MLFATICQQLSQQVSFLLRNFKRNIWGNFNTSLDSSFLPSLRYEWPTGVARFGCRRPVLRFDGDVCNLSDDLLILSGIRCWWGSQCPQFAIKVNSWAVIKCVSVAHNQRAPSPRVTAGVKGDCSDFIWPLITEFFTCTCCTYYEKNKLKCHLCIRHCINTVFLCDMGTRKHGTGDSESALSGGNGGEITDCNYINSCDHAGKLCCFCAVVSLS